MFAFAAATIGVAVWAMLFSLNSALRGQIPEFVAQALPQHRLADLIVLDRQVVSKPDAIVISTIPQVAARALAIDPLNARALLLLATERSAANDPARAKILAQLSERVTRRDVLTQFFLIEFAVQANDIPTVLRHYDRAIRTSPDSARLLFERLGSASSDPEISAGLRPYLRAPSPWMPGFLFHLLDTNGGAESAAHLLMTSAVVGQSGYFDDLLPTIIGKLIDQGHVNTAVQLAAMIPGVNKQSFKALSLAQGASDRRLGVLAWIVTDAGAGRVQWLDGHGGARLDISGASSAIDDQVLLRRIVSLNAGLHNYRTLATVRGGAAADPRLQWRVGCLKTGDATVSIWTSNLPTQSGMVQSRGPSIPADCPWQLVELVATGGDGIAEYDATIERLEFPAHLPDGA